MNITIAGLAKSLNTKFNLGEINWTRAEVATFVDACQSSVYAEVCGLAPAELGELISQSMSADTSSTLKRTPHGEMYSFNFCPTPELSGIDNLRIMATAALLTVMFDMLAGKIHY